MTTVLEMPSVSECSVDGCAYNDHQRERDTSRPRPGRGRLLDLRTSLICSHYLIGPCAQADVQRLAPPLPPP